MYLFLPFTPGLVFCWPSPLSFLLHIFPQVSCYICLFTVFLVFLNSGFIPEAGGDRWRDLSLGYSGHSWPGGVQCYAWPVHENRRRFPLCLCNQQHKVFWRCSPLQVKGEFRPLPNLPFSSVQPIRIMLNKKLWYQPAGMRWREEMQKVGWGGIIEESLFFFSFRAIVN